MCRLLDLPLLTSGLAVQPRLPGDTARVRVRVIVDPSFFIVKVLSIFEYSHCKETGIHNEGGMLLALLNHMSRSERRKDRSESTKGNEATFNSTVQTRETW